MEKGHARQPAGVFHFTRIGKQKGETVKPTAQIRTEGINLPPSPVPCPLHWFTFSLLHSFTSSLVQYPRFLNPWSLSPSVPVECERNHIGPQIPPFRCVIPESNQRGRFFICMRKCFLLHFQCKSAAKPVVGQFESTGHGFLWIDLNNRAVNNISFHD